jgi:hypothetical protein
MLHLKKLDPSQCLIDLSLTWIYAGLRHPKHEDYDIEWIINDAIDHTPLKLQKSKEKISK